MDDKLLEVKGLKKYFPIVKGVFRKKVGDVKAVDGISFDIYKGETLGLVGESGCGKTTAGRTLVRLLEPTSGQVNFKLDENNLVDIMGVNQNKLWDIRQKIQMIFQDPYASLDSRMTIKDIVGEPLLYFKNASKKEREKRVKELLKVVGLDGSIISRYPHAFSGGQRQRIGIARALAINPELVIADEPVSALDVSVQAQVLNLMNDLQNDFDLTYLFIAHDLGVVEHVCDRIAVMYVGKLVEIAETEEIFHNPQHPYLEALLSAVPRPDPHYDLERMVLEGEVADPANTPEGCSFHPRCQYAQEICRKQEPDLKGSNAHKVACHFAQDLGLKGIEIQQGKAN